MLSLFSVTFPGLYGPENVSFTTRSIAKSLNMDLGWYPTALILVNSKVGNFKKTSLSMAIAFFFSSPF